jgi:hypothetical protein
VHVFGFHDRRVQRQMRAGLHRQFIFHNRRNAVLGAGIDNGIRTDRPDAQRHHADGPAHGHGAQDVTLACVVGGAVPVEVSFNNFTLLPRIVDGRCRQADTDYAHAQGERDRDTGYRGRCCCPRYQASVVLPLPLQLFRGHVGAFCVELLEIERHGGRNFKPG